MPPDCAFGTFFSFFFSGAGALFGAGGLGTAKTSRLSATGVAISACEMPRGSLSLEGTAEGVTGPLFGPPPLKDARLFNGTLTNGIGGAISVTGVGGRCIVTFGGASSAPRMSRSASFNKDQRTS